VYSKSKQKWITGKVMGIKDGKVCVKNGRKFTKWVKPKRCRVYTPSIPAPPPKPGNDLSLAQSLTTMAGCDGFANDLINLAFSSKNLLSPKSTGESSSLRSTNKSNSTPTSPKSTMHDASLLFPEMLIPLETQRKNNFLIRTGTIQAQAVSSMEAGSLVEVYSKTKDKWVVCKLKYVKGNCVRVVYGNDNKQRWVRRSQCRPFCPGATYTTSAKDDISNMKPRSIVSVQTIRAPFSKEDDAERGQLRIRVEGALHLKSEGNYATVTVSGMKLRTGLVKSDLHPIWNDPLVFSNFRPDSSKFATIKVKRARKYGSVVVGSARFRLPLKFDRCKTMVLKLVDSNRNSAGVVSFEHIVIKNKK